MKIRLLLAVLSVAVASFCGAAEDAGVHPPLALGLAPVNGHAVPAEASGPLVSYLEKRLGRSVALTAYDRQQDAIDALGRSEIDAALLPASAYIKCREQYPESAVRPVLRLRIGREGTERSCIVTSMDSGLRGLSSLVSESFAFGSVYSVSEYLMPRKILKDAGIDPASDLGAFVVLESPDEILRRVDSGDFKAGAASQADAMPYIHGEALRVLARGPEFPTAPVCVSARVGEDVVQDLVDALQALSDQSYDGRRILKALDANLAGFDAAADADYDGVRRLIDETVGDTFYRREPPRD